RRDLLEVYPIRRQLFQTVPNPYVSDEMAALPKPARRTGRRIMLTAARMMPQKRLDVLLRAFALTSQTDTKLIILGDGPLRASLERLAHSLGIADRVEMPGFVENIVPWLQQTDLFVLSSD